jgi:hypothetical protein
MSQENPREARPARFVESDLGAFVLDNNSADDDEDHWADLRDEHAKANSRTMFKDGDPAYGLCPECGASGESRERRPNGNDTCEAGHVYPSASAVHPQAKLTESFETPHAADMIDEWKDYP